MTFRCRHIWAVWGFTPRRSAISARPTGSEAMNFTRGDVVLGYGHGVPLQAVDRYDRRLIHDGSEHVAGGRVVEIAVAGVGLSDLDALDRDEVGVSLGAVGVSHVCSVRHYGKGVKCRTTGV